MESKPSEVQIQNTPNKNTISAPKENTQTIIHKTIEADTEQSLDNWYFLIISFLELTKKTIETIQSEGVEKNRLLIIPALHNLKHLIEILIKYLSISTGIGHDLSHDIGVLIKAFMESQKITEEKNPKEYNACESLTKTVIKYDTFEFLSHRFSTFQIKDARNELFRYPDGNIILKRVNYSEFAENIDLADINNILQDINLLQGILEKLKKYFIPDKS